MKLKLSPFAEKDLEESISYYNKQFEGLGIEFIQNIDETFNRIKENPNQFPVDYRQMRKARTERFPFVIFLL